MKNFIRNLIRKFYKRKVLNNLKEYKEPLKVNSYSFVNQHTFLGKNVNFSSSLIHLSLGAVYSSLLSYSLMFLSVCYYSNKVYSMPWKFWRYHD